MTYPLPVPTTIDSEIGPDACWHDRVQIALAIADEALLKSLLIDCTPPLVQAHRLAGVRSTIGVPVAADRVADGTIEFEEVHCVLAESLDQLEQGVAEYTRRNGNERGYLDLTHYETETQILGQSMSMTHAISLLSHAGYGASQVKHILNLPYDAWHKSWWYLADEWGEFTIPFLRLLRTRRYTDGTYTLQYKDFFAQEQPRCFKSRSQQVLVEIMPEQHQFSATLAKLNSARQQTGITQALVICDRISDLEARGFISQGISLYAAQEIALPVKANCDRCATQDCPMRGKPDSPVLLCQRFCLNPE
ncbi:MAG: hypothetical protein EDM05_027645 [Leptolyngbya sp. IPPAS B-1204]|nr:hypothetical protein [Elainella sp. C42_A2020_010]RNJ66825.1 MAG: hypothetical protein EDM05_23445 [Leptolyngbya sp. IPPAS B-1204]